MNRKLALPAVLAAVLVFSLAAIFPAVIAEDNNSGGGLFGDNETSTSSLNATDSAMNETSTAAFILDNGTLDCQAIAQELDGIGVPNGNVCDVVVVRQSPQITGDNGLNLNQFTLMNSVLEFLVVPDNGTLTTTAGADTSNMTTFEEEAMNTSSESSNASSTGLDLFSSSGENSSSPSNTVTASTTENYTQQVYVMGDFALLETEMNDVLTVVKDNGWTVTGIHNHMINENPKTTFMHWEAQGDINEIIDQANQAFEKTSIKD